MYTGLKVVILRDKLQGCSKDEAYAADLILFRQKDGKMEVLKDKTR